MRLVKYTKWKLEHDDNGSSQPPTQRATIVEKRLRTIAARISRREGSCARESCMASLQIEARAAVEGGEDGSREGASAVTALAMATPLAALRPPLWLSPEHDFVEDNCWG